MSIDCQYRTYVRRTTTATTTFSFLVSFLIVLPILSVCLSVRLLMPGLCQNEGQILILFSHLGRGIIVVFLARMPLQNSKGNPPSGGIKYRWCENFCRYRHLPCNLCKIGPQLLWNTNRSHRNPVDPCRFQ